MGTGDRLLAIMLFGGFGYVIRGVGRCGGVMVAGTLYCVSRAWEGIAVAFGGLLVSLFGCLVNLTGVCDNYSCSFILLNTFFVF